MRIYTKEARMYNYSNKNERKIAKTSMESLLNYTKVERV